MAFEPFQKFFDKAARTHGMKRQIQAAEVCHQARKAIPEIFEKLTEAPQNINPANYKDSILVINTTTPAWAQEVIMRKSKIIDELNTRLGKNVIKDLKTQISS